MLRRSSSSSSEEAGDGDTYSGEIDGGNNYRRALVILKRVLAKAVKSPGDSTAELMTPFRLVDTCVLMVLPYTLAGWADVSMFGRSDNLLSVVCSTGKGPATSTPACRTVATTRSFSSRLTTPITGAAILRRAGAGSVNSLLLGERLLWLRRFLRYKPSDAIKTSTNRHSKMKKKVFFFSSSPSYFTPLPSSWNLPASQRSTHTIKHKHRMTFSHHLFLLIFGTFAFVLIRPVDNGICISIFQVCYIT